MTTSLIQDAYETFGKYHLNDKLTGCYCGVCLTNEFNDRVHNTHLKNLTPSDLNFYVAACNILDDNCNDFRYFLPRMLEVLWKDITIKDDSDFSVFVWSVLAKIDFDKWPYEEQEIVRQFFKLYWNESKEPGEIELLEPSMNDIKNEVFDRLKL